MTITNRHGTTDEPTLPGPDLVFPTAEGSTLARRSVVLPRDFEGALNLVLVVFKEAQQALVDSWIPEARALAEQHEALRFYEVPTLARYNPAYRWFINRGMRAGIPDPATRALTIVLYLDKAAFRDALGLPDEETIYVLLLDRDGRVLWRTEGAFAPEKASLLRRAVEQETEAVTW